MKMALNTSDSKNYGSVCGISSTSAVNQKYRKSSFSVADNIHKIQKECLEILNISKQLSSLTESQSSLDTALLEKLNSCMSTVKFIIADTAVDINGLVRLIPSLSSTQKVHVRRLKGDFGAAVQSYGNLQKSLLSKTSKPKRRNPFDEYERTTSDRQLLLEEEQAQKHKQTQMLRQMQADAEVLVTRQEILGEIEKNVLDINDIMKQLASMVDEQADSVNAIENNVESTAVYVTGGTDELRKASTHQATRRRCSIFLLMVAISALLVLGIVLYFELKPSG